VGPFRSELRAAGALALPAAVRFGFYRAGKLKYATDAPPDGFSTDGLANKGAMSGLVFFLKLNLGAFKNIRVYSKASID
jgi:hypothetical protein